MNFIESFIKCDLTGARVSDNSIGKFLVSDGVARSSRLLPGALHRGTSGCSTRAPVASVSEAFEATVDLKNKLPFQVLVS